MACDFYACAGCIGVATAISSRARASVSALVRLRAKRDRGRDGDCSPPPAQTRTGPIKASGSYLECLTAKRWLGQG